MPIWSAEIKELERVSESIKGQLPDLEKELVRLVKADDENMILLYSRRCLEVIITDLCECQLKRERGTEPLKGIIDKLHKEKKVPAHITTSMHGLNDLSTYGTHPKDFDPEQVKPVLNNLDIIIKWYLKHKETRTDIKVKPDEEIKHETKSPEELKKSIRIPKKRLTGVVSGLILLIVIVIAVLFFTNIIGSGKQTKELEKSIAVLPFINDSQVDSNKYFINGIMEEVLNNLQKINDFRVLSRTTTDQFKGQDRPTIPEIAKKINVNYIVEGSGQRYGDQFVLRVQLIAAKNERHLWAKSYNKEIQKTTDIISVQSDIAQLIASELKATITPEEKQLIEKTPTTNLIAYDFYQRGNDEFSKGNLVKAHDLYKKALVCDSTFAKAYAGLAHVYWDKNFFTEYYSETFMDSVRILCDIALSYDDQLEAAYSYRGFYYWHHGFSEQAVKDYDKAIEINPNSYLPYYAKGYLYEIDDLEKCIYNLQKATYLNHGPQLPVLLTRLSAACSLAGFIDIAEKYNLDILALDGDSAGYLYRSGIFENDKGNYLKSVNYGNKAYKLDSIQSDLLLLMGEDYMCVGQSEESLMFYKKWISILKNKSQLSLNNMHRIGFAYDKNGYKKEADSCFKKQIEYCNESINLHRPYGQSFSAFYDLAGINAFMGNKKKAYEDLRKFDQRKKMTLKMVNLIKNDPLFESIRNEPEFQQIVRDVEAKYQAEHERVKKWLEKQGML